MRPFLTISLAALLSATVAVLVAAEKKAEKPTAPPAAQENFCIACHGDSEVWEGEKRKFYVTEKTLATDIHWQKGLRCQDCHGGDPTTSDFAAAHSGGGGLRSIKPADLPVFCGKCHADIEYIKRFRPTLRTDQLAEYWTSGHGKHLQAGDVQVATCVSCHGHHGIRAVADLESPVYPTRLAKTCATCHSDAKLMAGRTYHGQPLGHDQYDLWHQSVHANALLNKGDLSAATCNRCHGNHGAVPPQVDSVANACGTCHGKVASLFANTQMRHRFEKVGLPGCVTCHSNHLIHKPSDEMLGMQGGAVCISCHANGKYGAPLAGADVAREMRKQLDRFQQQIEAAKRTVADAERLGMEVRGPRYDLRKAVDALTSTRVLIHSFDVKRIKASLAAGTPIVAEVQAAADRALREHTWRREWLAASLVPIVIVIGVLLLYIRKLPIPPGG